MSHDHYKSAREEWQEASPKSRKTRQYSRSEEDTQAGLEAFAKISAMFDEEPPPEQVDAVGAPCEHDYKPTRAFYRALQCTHCGALVEAPRRKTKESASQSPIECYEDLSP